MAKLKKILLKVINDSTDNFEWVHLAYADEELYLRFLQEMNCSRIEFANYVSKWVVEDFNLSLTMAHKNDISIVKKLVKDRYQKAHPYLVTNNGNTDRQGWMRVWVSKKMDEELKYYG